MAKKDKKTTVIPTGDRVLIKPEAEESKKTASGIYIPETAQNEKPERGKVVAVGEGKRNENGQLIPMRIKVGDIVIFEKYGNSEVKIEDEEYLIVNEAGIIAVIE